MAVGREAVLFSVVLLAVSNPSSGKCLLYIPGNDEYYSYSSW